MSACACGCTVRDEHVADCTGMTEDGTPCRGCRPRPCEVGVLCMRCWGRLQVVVRTLPALVDHLMEMAAPSVSSSLGGSGGGVRAAGPRSLYPPALGVADDLVAALASWCEQAAESLGLSAPPRQGLWRTREYQTVDPDTGEVYTRASEVAGVRDAWAATTLVWWLSPHLERVAECSWVVDLLDDLGSASSRAAARWPVEEPERRVTDVRCPSCGALSLVVHPPRVPGAEELVVCSRPVCGRVLVPEEWERTRAWALVVATMDTPAPDGEAVGA